MKLLPLSRRSAAPLAFALAAWLCLPGGPSLRGQDLPADPGPAPEATPAPGPSFLDGAPPAPNPTPAPPSSLLLDPGATPAPLPAPNPGALPRFDNRATPSGAPVPPGAGGALPAPDAPAAGGAGLLTSTSNTSDVRRFRYTFLFSLNATYTDNLFLGSTTKSSDLFFTLAPTVTLGYGDVEGSAGNVVSFSYSPEGLVYVNHPQDDTLQHHVSLKGVYHFAEVTLTGFQSINILNNTDFSQQGATTAAAAAGGTANNPGAGGTGTANPAGPNNPGAPPTQPVNQVNLDVAGRTSLQVYTTTLGANYAYSDKTSFDLNLGFNANEYKTFISSQSYTASLYANYSFTGKITVGAGLSGGYVAQGAPSPNEQFEQGNLRLTYLASDKFSLAGTVGVEARERDDTSRVAFNPVFSLSATYQPFDSTSLTLGASRQVSTSAVVGGEDINNTSFTFTVSQRFFQRLFASLSLGYTNSQYTTNGTAATPLNPNGTPNPSRLDNYFFVQPSLDYNLRDNLSVGAFYLFRRNDSNSIATTTNTGTFSNNEIGAHVSISF